MEKWFEKINAKDTDEVSWTGENGNKVTVTIAELEPGKWKPVLKGKKNCYVVRKATTTEEQ